MAQTKVIGTKEVKLDWIPGCISVKLVRFPNELDVGYDGMEELRMTANFLDWSVSRMDWPSNWIGETFIKRSRMKNIYHFNLKCLLNIQVISKE